ncbi:uncharacterized protein K489DRAFT_382165 [Dissoconium aciculare CBS 342.82]|uniref:CsbD-like domain-containing protein n=1 Tax=Dissoconium aciculare CBS 342.82 TaxID=1314786 RepID=A0A6J3LZD8_9PEZI|nr:uncharacterized protein K489DRAFT_382165 [Dissoconium aciculare CBS 342.82]KAF1821126.1 hypothetical protein K489DRAFT_382165 [Dissoconium aciculare CBS 342.82]
MTDKNTSTLQSYVDSATGAAQSLLGSLTGSQADKVEGDQKQDVAKAKDDVSHAGASVGGYSVSASGVAENHPDRQAGSWNQTIGAGKEFVGGTLGLQGLKTEGQQQNEQGKAQEAAGQLKDYGTGIQERVAGTVGGAIAGLTGDAAEQERRQAQHDHGKTLQRGAEADITTQADADARQAAQGK